MSHSDPDIEADSTEVTDRGENPTQMESMLLSDGSAHRPVLSDLVVDLVAASAGLRRSLPAGLLSALADLVRAMNCYYSNLIEGHDTHPVDIERAMKNDYSADTKTRTLQLEAKAHVPSSAGSMAVVSVGARSRLMPSARFTGASVSCYPQRSSS